MDTAQTFQSPFTTQRAGALSCLLFPEGTRNALCGAEDVLLEVTSPLPITILWMTVFYFPECE